MRWLAGHQAPLPSVQRTNYVLSRQVASGKRGAGVWADIVDRVGHAFHDPNAQRDRSCSIATQEGLQFAFPRQLVCVAQLSNHLSFPPRPTIVRERSSHLVDSGGTGGYGSAASATKNAWRQMPNKMTTAETTRAILTDVQFWIPATVLIGGIVLLVILH